MQKKSSPREAGTQTEDRSQKTGARSQKSAVGRGGSPRRPRPLTNAAVADRGPQTRDQHLSALAAKLDRNHSALFTVANDIVNLKRKLRRQEEIYRTLAANRGSRFAEYVCQLVELSNLDCAGLPAEGGAKGDQGLTAPCPGGGSTPISAAALSSQRDAKAASSRRTP